MVKVKDILREIEHYAPLPLQEGFDNAGVQVGDVNQHATGVLLCLDVTEEVLDEAIEMGCTCLHYGQEAFEGLKAYRCPDGKVRVFRPEENAARLQSTCRGIVMPELPTDLFVEMVEKVVRLNQDFIPPYESGATLYLRPLLVGTSAQVGVHEGQDYLFLIFATPVGPYFKGGFSTNAYAITREFDRAAPFGTGKYKVGGNYAASLRAHKIAKEKGYASEFYLDAKEKKYRRVAVEAVL